MASTFKKIISSNNNPRRLKKEGGEQEKVKTAVKVDVDKTTLDKTTQQQPLTLTGGTITATQQPITEADKATATQQPTTEADKATGSQHRTLANKDTVAEQVFLFLNAHLLVLFYVPTGVCLIYAALHYFWPEISDGIISLNSHQLENCKQMLQGKKLSLVEEYINCVQSLKKNSTSPMGLISKHINCQVILNKIN